MKQLNPNGSTSVVGTYPQRKTATRHDPFPSHANSIAVTSGGTCASGAVAYATDALLKDGSQFYYFYGTVPSATITPPYIISYAQFVLPPLIHFYAGVSYNYILRPLNPQKMTPTEFTNYLAAH